MTISYVAAVLLLACAGCAPAAPDPVRQPPAEKGTQEVRETAMNDSPTQVLQRSKEPKELQTAALALARSKRPEDHEALLGFLRRTEFLLRLDTPEDYADAAAKRLRISRVLEALATNEAPSARQVIVELAQDSNFLSEEARVDQLIRASAYVRPAPPALVTFWDKYSQPDDGFSNLTVEALVENGGEPALRLFEKKMADTRHGRDEKIAWLRTEVLPHRDDPPLLNACERLLAGALPQDLRPHLVEVLFDYRPDEWYRPASVSTPPDRSKASAEAREALRRIGELALRTVRLSDEQRAAVKKTLAEVGARP